MVRNRKVGKRNSSSDEGKNVNMNIVYISPFYQAQG